MAPKRVEHDLNCAKRIFFLKNSNYRLPVAGALSLDPRLKLRQFSQQQKLFELRNQTLTLAKYWLLA